MFQVLANVTFMINYAFLTELPFETLSLEFVNEGKGFKSQQLLIQEEKSLVQA
jgi:hypothetical protein